jgi:hypothetical protein
VSRVCFLSSLFTFPHYSLAKEFASSHPSLRFRITSSRVKSLLPLIPLYFFALLSSSRFCFFSSLFTFLHYSLTQEFSSSHPSLRFCIITLLLKSLLRLIPLYVSALLCCSRVCFLSSLKSLLRLIPLYISALLPCSRVCFLSSLFTFPHYSLAILV